MISGLGGRWKPCCHSNFYLIDILLYEGQLLHRIKCFTLVVFNYKRSKWVNSCGKDEYVKDNQFSILMWHQTNGRLSPLSHVINPCCQSSANSNPIGWSWDKPKRHWSLLTIACRFDSIRRIYCLNEKTYF